MDAALFLAKLPEAYQIFNPLVDVLPLIPLFFLVIGVRLASRCGFPLSPLGTKTGSLLIWPVSLTWAFLGARGKRQEARGKGQEARGKRQEARGKRQEARGKRQEARGGGGEDGNWELGGLQLARKSLKFSQSLLQDIGIGDAGRPVKLTLDFKPLKRLGWPYRLLGIALMTLCLLVGLNGRSPQAMALNVEAGSWTGGFVSGREFSGLYLPLWLPYLTDGGAWL